MKIQLAILLFSMSCARAIFGGTSILDLTKWDGVSDRFDGWFMNGVTQTASYGDGAKFAGGEHWIKSPRFPGMVTNVTLTLCCSTTGTPTRILAVYPLDGRGNSQGEFQFTVPAKTGKYENQGKDISKYGTDAFRIGVNSEKGNTGTWYALRIVVDYDETQPIAHSAEDVDVITRCWKLSEFGKDEDGRCVRTADFSFLSSVRQKTAWTNGVSVDSFYVFDNGQAATDISLGRPGSNNHGLYAVNTNEVVNDDSTNKVAALSLLPSKDAGMEILLPVELDIGCKVAGIEVSFAGWQGKIGTNDTTLAFSWCTSDTLLAIGTGGWKGRDEGNYSGGISNRFRSVVLGEKDVRDWRIVCFRWNVHRQAGGSMLGIADAQVSVRLKPEGTLLLIR